MTKIFEGIDGGFAPVLISVIKDLKSPMAALVYARIWNYCQMDDRVCKAGIETLCDDLEMSYNTVLKYIKLLCEKKYIKDLDPRVRNTPHRYKDLERFKYVAARFVENTNEID